MDRKDILYLMLIFILNNRKKYRFDRLMDFRDSVYDYLSDCVDVTMFKVRFLTYGLQLPEEDWTIRNNFIKFVNKIEKVYNSSQS